MRDLNLHYLMDAYNDLHNEMGIAFVDRDLEAIHYNFLRLYRLANKLEDYHLKAINQGNMDFRITFYRQLAEWKSKLAHYYNDTGDYRAAEREWFSILSFPYLKAEYYIQYAHSVLQNNDLFIHKNIEDNMNMINEFNVHEVLFGLKRAKFSLKAAANAEESTNEEAITNFLNWLNLLEKNINDSPDLLNAELKQRDKVTLEKSLQELHSLIGLPFVKSKMQEICDWVEFNRLRKEEGFKAEMISLHMIFSGNPGTGKTTVARLVAKIYQALNVLNKGHLVEASRRDLVAEYVGQTAPKTMKKIKEAEGGVLFIDEAYSLVRSQGNDFGIEAIDTLVKAMEDQRHNLIVILAGYPEEMENFIRSNPGLRSRFKYNIHFHDYSIQELLQIHDHLLQEREYKIEKENWDLVQEILTVKVSQSTEGHGNGRMVRNLIEEEVLIKASETVQDYRNGEECTLDTIDRSILLKLLQEQKGVTYDSGSNSLLQKMGD
ncbi:MULTISPECIES: AAA family ATPase [Pontibacillus]|uniref:AAA family ATPase n=1 Tax=Pontibacillus chungwhensis TaxID=265426 RepID=A0ABY8UWI7_9BACI|nr:MULTISPECIES: AAA family ATPase [Pontibacillus]MCD5324153.1 AAA family ATPase [Pontibacillus sp. HN14]WIF97788.1 AAA family ATPase [Pontibacillus chungwhensis]